MNRQQIVSKARSAATEVKARPQFLMMTVAAFALIVWVFISSGGVANRADRLSRVVESQQVLIDKLAVALDEARAQGAAVPAPEVIAADVPDVEVSPAVAGERGEAGAVGSVGETGAVGRGPTVEEIASAVAAYCANGRCNGPAGSSGSNGDPGESVVGPQGPPGEDGASIQGPSGPAGQDGQNGANGADSQVPGPQGPGPTDEQIAAAVTAYCSVPGNCTLIP